MPNRRSRLAQRRESGVVVKYLLSTATDMPGLKLAASCRRGRHAMANITVSNQVAAPVAAVFERFTDLESSPARVSGIKAIEKQTAGPFGLGTRWVETREVFGMTDTAEMEI